MSSDKNLNCDVPTGIARHNHIEPDQPASPPVPPAEMRASPEISWPPTIAPASAAETLETSSSLTSNERPQIQDNIVTALRAYGSDPTSTVPPSPTWSTRSGSFPTSLALRVNTNPIANGAVSSPGLFGPAGLFSNSESSSSHIADDIEPWYRTMMEDERNARSYWAQQLDRTTKKGAILPSTRD